MGALTDSVKSEVYKILKEKWDVRNGQKVPEAEDILNTNQGVRLEATCLYADLAESTKIVKAYSPELAAVIFKCYLKSASMIIKDQGGVITAFDGDRVMAVFIGTSPNSDAARVALAINHVVVKLLGPALKECFPSQLAGFTLGHGIGIDTSSLLVAKTGIRKYNDLVWIGRSANYAAKLSSIRDEGKAVWITEAVYNRLRDDVKLDNGSNMWAKKSWTRQANETIYCSSYTWAL